MREDGLEAVKQPQNAWERDSGKRHEKGEKNRDEGKREPSRTRVRQERHKR